MRLGKLDNASVVFDNNAYSAVGFARLALIQDAEAKLNIRPLASLVVAQELLARIDDADNGRRTRARTALQRLLLHCGDRSTEKPTVRLVADVDSQIRHLFSARDPAAQTLFDTYGGILGGICDLLATDVETSLAVFKPDLQVISEHVEWRERQYVSEMRMVIAQMQTGALSISEYRALTPLHLVARAITDPAERARALDPVQSDLIKIVDDICAIGLNLHVATLGKLADGMNIDSDANTLWDEEICCATSIFSTVQGAPVLLITEEKKLLASAVSAGAGDRVMAVRDYEARLGLVPWTAPTRPQATDDDGDLGKRRGFRGRETALPSRIDPNR